MSQLVTLALNLLVGLLALADKLQILFLEVVEVFHQVTGLTEGLRVFHIVVVNFEQVPELGWPRDLIAVGVISILAGSALPALALCPGIIGLAISLTGFGLLCLTTHITIAFKFVFDIFVGDIH